MVVEEKLNCCNLLDTAHETSLKDAKLVAVVDLRSVKKEVMDLCDTGLH